MESFFACIAKITLSLGGSKVDDLRHELISATSLIEAGDFNICTCSTNEFVHILQTFIFG